MKYDDAEFYFLNFETDDLPNEAGATHIGMFIAWLIRHDLVSENLQANAAAELEQVKSKKMTGREFLVDLCDCKLLDDDLSEDGNAFASWYYEANYLDDYAQVFKVCGETMVEFCSVADTWKNYDQLSPVLAKRFNEWQSQA